MGDAKSGTFMGKDVYVPSQSTAGFCRDPPCSRSLACFLFTGLLHLDSTASVTRLVKSELILCIRLLRLIVQSPSTQFLPTYLPSRSSTSNQPPVTVLREYDRYRGDSWSTSLGRLRPARLQRLSGPFLSSPSFLCLGGDRFLLLQRADEYGLLNMFLHVELGSARMALLVASHPKPSAKPGSHLQDE